MGPIDSNTVQAVLNADISKVLGLVVLAMILLIAFLAWLLVPILRRNTAAFERLATAMETVRDTETATADKIQGIEKKIEMIGIQLTAVPVAVADELKKYYYMREPGLFTRLTGGRI